MVALQPNLESERSPLVPFSRYLDTIFGGTVFPGSRFEVEKNKELEYSFSDTSDLMVLVRAVESKVATA